MLLDLFITFFIVGAVSFGGGYAMLPIIERDVVLKHQWMTSAEFSDAVAIAGMAPGPISANTAIYIGYHVAGLPGAIISMIGIVLPSVVVILFVLTLFYRWYRHRRVQSFFYGLRPVITALVAYAAIRFVLQNEQLMQPASWHAAALILIFAASLFALIKYRIHPLIIIIASGIVGAVLFH